MTDGFTGPSQLSKLEKEMWYHRFKDFANPIQQRGFAIGCHPVKKQFLIDQLERLKEDETWTHGENVPPLVVTKQINEDDIRPVDRETLKVLTMKQVNKSKKGFGRYKGLYIPNSDGLHDPWTN